MYHPSSKQRQIAKRFFIYGIMSLAVVSLVTLLILFMLGYRFNQSNGSLVQGGLVQFSTQPGGANVKIDDQLIGSRTPAKATVDPGQHSFSMERAGYRLWQKTLEIKAGSLTWLNYARLIPTEIKPVNIQKFDELASAVASPSGRRFAFLTNPQAADIIWTDLGRDEPEFETLTLPAVSYTAPAEGQSGQFEIVSWDNSERYILMRHTYNDDKAVEWIVVDLEDIENTRNMTKILGVPAEKVLFGSNNGRIFYIKSNNDVRKVDLIDATLSRPLVSNVADFSIYSERIMTYVTNPSETAGAREVGYYRDGEESPDVIKKLAGPADLPLMIQLGEYYNEMYVAIAHGNIVEVSKGRLPTPDAASSLKSVATMNLTDNVTDLDIKGSGRFIYARNGSSFATYDLERQELHQTKLPGDNVQQAQLEWLDQFMLWTDNGGELSFYEFDGGNHQTLSGVAAGFDIALTPNGRYVYSINRDDDGYNLQQIRLILR